MAKRLTAGKASLIYAIGVGTAIVARKRIGGARGSAAPPVPPAPSAPPDGPAHAGSVAAEDARASGYADSAGVPRPLF